MSREPEILPIGQTVTGQAQEGCFKFYSLEVTDTSQMLTIASEPADEESDPDIYISFDTPIVNQTNYTWKSTNIGADKVELHPKDPQYQPGTYYIAILAYKSGLNTFLTTAKYSSVAELNDLDSEYTGELGSWMYFKFPVEYPSESRIEITASGNGKLAMFISPTVYYPSEEEHTWSSGIAEWKHFLGNLEDYCVDIDPFDKFMPKEYTRKPTAKDLKRLDVEESEEQNENTLVRFCNDTDDWKYSSNTCYVGVKNLGAEAFEFSIKQQEVVEETLLDQEIIQKYEWFKQVFSESEASSLSQKERKRLQVANQSEFTYGEIEFIHIHSVFELCEPQPGQVFWDLGCGAGKCMLAAALLYPQLGQVKGVEYLPALFQQTQKCFESLSSQYQLPPLSVYQGDMLEIDWSDADIVFTSSICFPNELIDGILEKSRLLKKGAKIITLKLLPPNDIFEVKHNLRVKMTWGKTGVYIIEKIK